MNCYTGLAKRIIKSCFPEVKLSQVIPVPQLQPLDARNIIKHEVKDITTSKECFALSDAEECLFKPISHEEAWEAALVWAEAKAQEREAAAPNDASKTDTDTSYDSDDDDYEAIHSAIDMIMQFEEEERIAKKKRITREKEESLLKSMLESQSLSGDDTAESYDSDDFELGVSIHPLDMRPKSALFAGSDTDESYDSDTDDNIEEFTMTTVWERVATRIALYYSQHRAAIIIQAAARGRAVRAWNAIFTDGLALELVNIYRSRYLMRHVNEMTALEKQLAEQWDASPKYARAWIKLAERRRYGNHFRQINHM